MAISENDEKAWFWEQSESSVDLRRNVLRGFSVKVKCMLHGFDDKQMKKPNSMVATVRGKRLEHNGPIRFGGVLRKLEFELQHLPQC